MKQRLVLLALLVAIAVLPSCAMILPNTSEILEPHGFEDLLIAIGADIEMLIEMYGNFGFGLLFL